MGMIHTNENNNSGGRNIDGLRLFDSIRHLPGYTIVLAKIQFLPIIAENAPAVKLHRFSAVPGWQEKIG